MENIDDTFDKINNNVYKIINILETIKEKSIDVYHEWTDRCSGKKNSSQNDKIRNISYEFASFIAGLESKIQLLYGFGYENEHNYKHRESLKKLKNNIVDAVFPVDREKCKTREEYQNNMRKAGKFADLLERFFMIAYDLGKGYQNLANSDFDMNETCFKEYMYNCDQRLQTAYNKGSRELLAMLQLAISSPEAMQEFKERGML